ncbi:MAG: hypothetical protein J3Q66DRAFT_324325 [Benniella sp.]|nr:MAG: hypothetical protein J3Q66DRAFT_324325 [Benniella sp.]
MFLSLVSPTTFTLFAFTLSFLVSVFCSPSVLAQKFRPAPNHAICSAFIEGRGFYILGGLKGENFMLDLSISWNASDPVYKKLQGGPKVMGRPCATTNDELFMMFNGIGYLHNLSSGSWGNIHNDNIDYNPYSGLGEIAVIDPETRTAYFPANELDGDGNGIAMLSVDLKTGAFNTSDHDIYVSEGIHVVVWNAYLKSMLVIHALYPPDIFTPSKVSQSSTGWDIMDDGQKPDVIIGWACGASALGGTKMIFLEKWGPVYIWDVVKTTWKKGPLGPKLEETSCAVSGDQFILWGGYTGENETLSDKTYIYNMKTDKWASRYIASPLQPITITATAPRILQPSQTSTQHVSYATTTPESGNTSLGDKNILIITVAVIGVLVTVNLGFIFRYYRRSRRLNPDGSSSDSLDIKEHPMGSHRCDPSDFVPNSTTPSSDHNTSLGWHVSGVPGRLHQGSLGARELSEHPHAIVEDPTLKRNVQEGAFGVQILSQHPHAMVGDEYTSKYGDKVIHQPTRHYGDKEELRDQ